MVITFAKKALYTQSSPADDGNGGFISIVEEKGSGRGALHRAAGRWFFSLNKITHFMKVRRID